MSLETLLDTIRRDGEGRVQMIATRSRMESEERLSNAQAEAQRLHEQARQAVVVTANRERARILHHARLEALRIVGEAREALVAHALDQIRERLAQARSQETYPATLQYLIEEALRELGQSLRADETVALTIDSRDHDVVERIVNTLDRDLIVDASLDSWGGMIARSKDGKITVTNTFESRLEQAKTRIRNQILAALEVSDID